MARRVKTSPTFSPVRAEASMYAHSFSYAKRAASSMLILRELSRSFLFPTSMTRASLREKPRASSSHARTFSKESSRVISNTMIMPNELR